MQAYFNWGRWVVDCPTCNSAEQMQPKAAVFYCRECGHTGPVEWPENPAEIEEVLAKRPKRDNRNWRPGETLEALRLENVLHGVEEG